MKLEKEGSSPTEAAQKDRKHIPLPDVFRAQQLEAEVQSVSALY